MVEENGARHIAVLDPDEQMRALDGVVLRARGHQLIECSGSCNDTCKDGCRIPWDKVAVVVIGVGEDEARARGMVAKVRSCGSRGASVVVTSEWLVGFSNRGIQNLQNTGATLVERDPFLLAEAVRELIINPARIEANGGSFMRAALTPSRGSELSIDHVPYVCSADIDRFLANHATPIPSAVVH